MIKKVVHIADIHIRLYRRNEEYMHVLKKFLEEIKPLRPDRIVIVGDLFHAKITLSPEAVLMAGWFLRECANICKTIVTIGNHDFIANNKGRLDSITPIIELLNHENLVYYKDSGCYVDENVVWCVYSQLNHSQRPEGIEDYYERRKRNLVTKDPNQKLIGLYHDPINVAETDIEHKFYGANELDIFNGLDAVMAGDIHKHQVHKFDGNNKFIYPSSLIVQNFGEHPINHGYVTWDLETMEHKFNILDNDYGLYKIKINNIEEIEQI